MPSVREWEPFGGTFWGVFRQNADEADPPVAMFALRQQADGYLGFVAPQDDPGLTAAVAEINTARARLYAETARRHGVSPEVAGVAAAKALFETKLRPGDYYRDATGVWRRK